MQLHQTNRKNLGFGIGLRPVHFSELLDQNQAESKIDWLEIISENYMKTGGYAKSVLEKLRHDYPIAAHGVGLSIAGKDPIDEKYLDALCELVSWLEPQMVTDHLCWTSWKGVHTYDLLPFPLNKESLDHVAARVEYVQKKLGRTILLENPSAYIAFKGSTMSEPDFLYQLTEKTGCGILLDLNNCIVNARNLGWSPIDYLEILPSDRVGQFHLAGHHYGKDISIDTHDEKVPDKVWELFAIASQKFPDASVLLEWDDKIPSLNQMKQELHKAREYYQSGDICVKNKEESKNSITCSQTEKIKKDKIDDKFKSLISTQEKLFNDIKNNQIASQRELVETPSGSTCGLKVYLNAYRARIREVMQATFPTLFFILEDELFGELVQAYESWHHQTHFSIDYLGQNLFQFLTSEQLHIDFGAEQSLVAAIAKLEWEYYALHIKAPTDQKLVITAKDIQSWEPATWESVKLQLRPSETTLIESEWPVFDIWLEAKEEKISAPPEKEQELIVLERIDHDVHIRRISKNLYTFWKLLESGAQLEELVATIDEQMPQEALKICLKELLYLAEHNLLRKTA